VPKSGESRDTGLAGERTALAQNRSKLAVVVCIAVLVRHLWPLDSAARDIAVCLIAAAAMVWSIVLWTFTRSRAHEDGPMPLERPVLALMTAATVLLAVVGFVLALFTPS